MSPRQGPAPLDSTTTFVVLWKEKKPEDLIEYRCLTCDDVVHAPDSYKHAISVHRSAVIRMIWRE